MSDKTSRPQNPPQGQTSPAPGNRPSAPSAEGAEQGSGDVVPPVDPLLLQALLRKELPEAQARQVFRWVYTDPAWDDAYNRLLFERLRAFQQRNAPS